MTDVIYAKMEDVHHALHLCLKLAELWQEVPLWNHSILKQCDNFIDLLGCILIENRDPTLFSMVICAVWNRRNNIRLDKQTITLRQLLQQAKDWFQEFSALLANPAPQWIPPTASWRPPNAS